MEDNLLLVNKTYRSSQRAIDMSTPNSAHCLIANIIRLTLPNSWSVYVTADSIRFNVKDTRYFWPTPAKLAVLASEFDKKYENEGAEQARRAVKPFSFQLDGRNGYSAPVNRKGPSTGHRRGKDKKPRKKRSVFARRRYMGLRVIRDAQ